MSNLGHTETEWHSLHQQQYKLKEQISLGVVGHGDDIKSNNEPAFQEMRKMNNKLWDHVCDMRDAMNDSKNVNLIAINAMRQAESLVQVPQYDANRLAQMLVRESSVRIASGSKHCKWKCLGFKWEYASTLSPLTYPFCMVPLMPTWSIWSRSIKWPSLGRNRPLKMIQRRRSTPRTCQILLICNYLNFLLF